MPEFHDYAPMLHSLANHAKRTQKSNPGDYLDAEGLLVCGKCGQRRRRFVNIPAAIPSDPGRVIRMEVASECRCDIEAAQREEAAKKEEAMRENILKLRPISLMDAKFNEATFENYRVTKHNQKNMQICRGYAEQFPEMLKRNQGLLLWGDVGRGKSWAAACIANYLLSRNVPVVMTSLVKIVQQIEKDKSKEQEIINLMRSASLVILDDLGAERDTSFGLEKVFNVVDSRSRQKMPVIYTTNITVQEMMEEQDMRCKRIFSRVLETCRPLQFTGPDWRIMEANKRFKELDKLLGL